MAVAAAAAAALTGHELYAFPAAHLARPRVRAPAPAPWCARPRRHRARPRPLQVKGASLLLSTAGDWQAPTGPLPFPLPQDPYPDVIGPAAGPSAEITWWFPLSVLCLLLSPAWLFGFWPPTLFLIPRTRERVKAMFYHAYDSYLENAFPYDELRPLTCDGHDTWGR